MLLPVFALCICAILQYILFCVWLQCYEIDLKHWFVHIHHSILFHFMSVPLFIYLFFCHTSGMWILASDQGSIEVGPSGVKACNRNHWAARKLTVDHNWSIIIIVNGHLSCFHSYLLRKILSINILLHVFLNTNVYISEVQSRTAES